ncbi:hypothetical protein BT69DRAFT_1279486 [Atractiella rhizophila]|nr:hypothetical protein BT69DRAFT_1279486 [Atractiella rhizophila]
MFPYPVSINLIPLFDPPHPPIPKEPADEVWEVERVYHTVLECYHINRCCIFESAEELARNEV